MQDKIEQEDIEAIKRGQFSINDAIRRLDLVKNSLDRVNQFELTINKLNQDLKELQRKQFKFMTNDEMLMKLQSNSEYYMEIFGNKLISFSDKFLLQLNQKIGYDELFREIEHKATDNQIQSLNQRLKNLELVLDHHIKKEYENFKTKNKIELKSKVPRSSFKRMLKDLLSTTVQNINLKFTDLEQQIKELQQSPMVFQQGEKLGQTLRDYYPNDDLEGVIARDGYKTVDQQLFKQDDQQIYLDGTQQQQNQQGGANQITIDWGRVDSRLSNETSQGFPSPGRFGKIETLQNTVNDQKEQFQKIQSEFEYQNKQLDDSISQQMIMQEQLQKMQSQLQRVKKQQVVLIKSSSMDAPESVKRLLSDQDQYYRVQIELIQKELRSKTERLVVLETNFNNLSKKQLQHSTKMKQKVDEILTSFASFSNDRHSIVREIRKNYDNIKSLEKTIVDNQQSLEKEIHLIKGPLQDVLSNQNRENQILHEDLVRHQSLFRTLVDEPSGELSQIMQHNPSQLLQSLTIRKLRNITPSPQLSLKSRLHQGSKSPSINIEENWLKGWQNGKGIKLPRVQHKANKSAIM